MIKEENIRRHGKYIILGNRMTAEERLEGNLRALIIRSKGKVVYRYGGSSLRFSNPLTQEDKYFLAYLAR